MTALLTTGLSNVALAAVLALPAAAVDRWGRRPAVTHGLWPLVLLKLVTPPFRQDTGRPTAPISDEIPPPPGRSAGAPPASAGSAA